MVNLIGIVNGSMKGLFTLLNFVKALSGLSEFKNYLFLFVS